jgi:hypothetical protein
MAKYIHVIYGDPRRLPYLSSIGSTWQNEKRIVPRKRENNPKHPLEDEVSKPTDPNSKATETPTQKGFPLRKYQSSRVSHRVLYQGRIFSVKPSDSIASTSTQCKYTLNKGLLLPQCKKQELRSSGSGRGGALRRRRGLMGVPCLTSSSLKFCIPNPYSSCSSNDTNRFLPSD